MWLGEWSSSGSVNGSAFPPHKSPQFGAHCRPEVGDPAPVPFGQPWIQHNLPRDARPVGVGVAHVEARQFPQAKPCSQGHGQEREVAGRAVGAGGAEKPPLLVLGERLWRRESEVHGASLRQVHVPSDTSGVKRMQFRGGGGSVAQL